MIGDRIRETTTTTGTGTYNLGGAVTGRLAFIDVIGTGKVVDYICESADGTQYEIGSGTVTSGSPNTLSRTTIYLSSNSNNAVNWTSGSKIIYSGFYSDFVRFDKAGNLPVAGGSADVLTLTHSPTLKKLRNGQWFLFESSASPNATTTPTLNIDSTGAKTLVKGDGTALSAGTISASTLFLAVYRLSGDKFWIINLGGAGGGSGTVNSGTAGQLAYYASSTTAVSGNANATISAGSLTLGVSGGTIGKLLLAGNTSGAITIAPQAAAGTYNFNLPTTAGSSGNVLTSAGGVGSPMTWTALATVATTGSASDLGSGTLAAARLPALAGGDVTSSAGSAVTAIGAGKVTNTMLAGSITQDKIIGNAPLLPFGPGYISDTAGRIFPNYHSGAGGNAAPRDYGYGVKASLDADATLELRFLVPSVLPAGTPTLVLYSLANATSGALKLTIKDGKATPASSPAAGGNPSAVTLTSETQDTITWAASENDRYKKTSRTLTGLSGLTGGDVIVVGITFNTTGTTLAQISTHLPHIDWL